MESGKLLSGHVRPTGGPPKGQIYLKHPACSILLGPDSSLQYIGLLFQGIAPQGAWSFGSEPSKGILPKSLGSEWL